MAAKKPFAKFGKSLKKIKPVSLLPTLSAVILAISFWSPLLTPLALIGLLPFLLFLEKTNTSVTRQTWWFGFVFMGLTLRWYFDLDPEVWLPLSSTFSFLIVFVAWFLSALAYSVPFILMGWYLNRFYSIRSAWWQRLIVFGSVWILVEYLRSWSFSVASFGDGATLGAHWNFGALGLSAVQLNLGIVARLVGFYGLSFAVIALNFGAFELYRRRNLRPVMFSGLGIALLAAPALLLYQSDTLPSLRVMSLQINDDGNNNYYDEIAEAADITSAPYLTVLPEYSEFFEDEGREEGEITQRKELLQRWFGQTGGDNFLITSHESGGVLDTAKFNEIVAYDKYGSKVASEVKHFLIPAGEYVPYILVPALDSFGQSAIEFHNAFRAVQPSKELEKPMLLGSYRIGALACSGVITPQLYRGMARQDSQILTNSASLNIFASAPTYHFQAEQMVRFHAVANAKPFVQGTKNGISYIVDETGMVRAQSDKSKTKDFEIIQGSVRPNDTRTLYTRLGDYFIYLALAGLFVNYLKGRRAGNNR